MMNLFNKLEDLIVALNVEEVTTVCHALIKSKVPMNKVFETIRRALNIVGQRYEEGEYFLSELIMAGEVVQDVLNVLKPNYNVDGQKTIATVVLATVKGDLHDLGKNIFAMLLQSSGFKVVDLGIDVGAGDIRSAVEVNGAEVLGLSALLTTTVPEVETVLNELKRHELRDKIKVIVGGAAMNRKVAEKYGADAWGRTAVDGLKICKQWFGAAN